MTQDWKNARRRGPLNIKIEFAASDRVEDMRRMADEFMMHIFDFLPGEYLTTNESSIRDFTEFASTDTSEIWVRIEAAWSLTKTDVPS